MRSWGMKQKSSGLAEVQVDAATSRALVPRGFGAHLSAVFVVDLPEGARVSVPAGFDADEVFNLLLVVREALR